MFYNMHGTSVRCQSFVTDSVCRFSCHFAFKTANLITSQQWWGCDRVFHCSQFLLSYFPSVSVRYLPIISHCHLYAAYKGEELSGERSSLYFVFFCVSVQYLIHLLLISESDPSHFPNF